jgi:acyl carrier protein
MTMTTIDLSSDIAARLSAVLDEFEIEHDGLSPDTRLRGDLDIDSAELVEIVAAVAGRRLPDGKALKAIATVGELILFLERLDA